MVKVILLYKESCTMNNEHPVKNLPQSSKLT